jgi:2-hydroxy fatty acid dioxygenase
MKNQLEFYRSYHQHPINKFIHSICIPLIVFTTMSLIQSNNTSLNLKITLVEQNETYNLSINLFRIIYTIYCVYYLFISCKIFVVMSSYLYLISLASSYFITNYPNWYNLNLYLMAFAWISQFIGHYIEGNRPALLNSLSQAVFQAPLFTLEYIFPNLFK